MEPLLSTSFGNRLAPADRLPSFPARHDVRGCDGPLYKPTLKIESYVNNLIKDRQAIFPACLALATIALLSILPIAEAASSSTSTASAGFAAYSVQVTRAGAAQSAAVNESVKPTSVPGKSVVQLTVQGASSNFTYSHIVNSSSTLFPYLPAISNENYSYSGKNYSVTAKISQQGTSQVTFKGKSYTVTNYALSAKVTSTKGSETYTGTISAFPSDLVYSATLQANQTRASATLTATSLSLDAVGTAAPLQAASAGIGISLAVGAIALSLGVKMRRKQGAAGTSNPDHWVD